MAIGNSQAANPLSILRQLEWRVRHAVENTLSGEYRSAFRGRGMEFDQVVRYEYGDDVRDIDWNVTAKLGEPYRKKFVEEREVTLLLVMEDSPTLNFGSGAQSKREAIMELAGLVMLLGAVNGDRVGFVHASPDGPHLPRAGARPRGDHACGRLPHGAGGALARRKRSRYPLEVHRARRAEAQCASLARRLPAAGRARRMGRPQAALSDHGLPCGRSVGARAPQGGPDDGL